MAEHIPNTNQWLLTLMLARRDAGITGKFLKMVRARAMSPMLATTRGDMLDLDLMWIGAGCPKEKEPRKWLASVEAEVALQKAADELGVEPSSLVLLDDRSIN
jgi:hypothetical protein